MFWKIGQLLTISEQDSQYPETFSILPLFQLANFPLDCHVKLTLTSNKNSEQTLVSSLHLTHFASVASAFNCLPQPANLIAVGYGCTKWRRVMRRFRQPTPGLRRYPPQSIRSHVAACSTVTTSSLWKSVVIIILLIVTK